jgi:hypothetical protein
LSKPKLKIKLSSILAKEGSTVDLSHAELDSSRTDLASAINYESTAKPTPAPQPKKPKAKPPVQPTVKLSPEADKWLKSLKRIIASRNAFWFTAPVIVFKLG